MFRRGGETKKVQTAVSLLPGGLLDHRFAVFSIVAEGWKSSVMGMWHQLQGEVGAVNALMEGEGGFTFLLSRPHYAMEGLAAGCGAGSLYHTVMQQVGMLSGCLFPKQVHDGGWDSGSSWLREEIKSLVSHWYVARDARDKVFLAQERSSYAQRRMCVLS